MNQYIFSFIVLLVFFMIYFFMRNKLNIEKNDKVIYTHVNKVHKLLELVFIILAAVFFYLINIVFNYTLEAHYFIGTISILFALRALMEWKFKKESKHYILNILSSIALFVIFIGMEFFFT